MDDTKIYNYLVDLTFYAGSDDPENIDRGLYIITTEKPFTEDEMKKIIEKTNSMLADFSENDFLNDNTYPDNFPMGYYEGLNIHTLIDGLRCQSNIIAITHADDTEHSVNDVYKIEQWQ